MMSMGTFKTLLCLGAVSTLSLVVGALLFPGRDAMAAAYSVTALVLSATGILLEAINERRGR